VVLTFLLLGRGWPWLKTRLATKWYGSAVFPFFFFFFFFFCFFFFIVFFFFFIFFFLLFFFFFIFFFFVFFFFFFFFRVYFCPLLPGNSWAALISSASIVWLSSAGLFNVFRFSFLPFGVDMTPRISFFLSFFFFDSSVDPPPRKQAAISPVNYFVSGLNPCLHR